MWGVQMQNANLDQQYAEQYRQYANEYRALADRLQPGEGRELLAEIAATWERLAGERERQPQLVLEAA
jgi:hypothetical protein